MFCRLSLSAIVVWGALWSAIGGLAHAQFFSAPVELSSSVQVDEADNDTRLQLARIEAQAAQGQWDEVVEALRQIAEGGSTKVIGVTPRRYVPISDYCHMQLAALPEDALALYRRRVDPQAVRWYAEGVAKRDAASFERIVRELFCSSWGDSALLALGELATEQGDHGGARGYWQQIVARPPTQVPANRFKAATARGTTPAETDLLTHWYRVDAAAMPPEHRLRGDRLLPDDVARRLSACWNRHGVRSTVLMYPDTDLELAAVRARLVLVSILEGDLARATGELEAFQQLHPGAKGHLAGKQVAYAGALTELIKTASAWRRPVAVHDWSTFAGAADRNGTGGHAFEVGRLAWQPRELGQPTGAGALNWHTFRTARVAEDARRLLVYHPVTFENIVLLANKRQIFAFDMHTGAPAWSGDPGSPPGQIYVDEFVPQERITPRGLGTPRFTLTVHKGRLYARMGSQITTRPVDAPEEATGSMVCLDLSAQGRLVWKIRTESEKWSFEGSPIVEGDNLLVALRKSDVRPQAHVACYDPQTGQPRWRRLVCAAETPGGGQYPETTHNLLTAAHGRVYYNTNLGAVAAFNARDGSIRWVTLYDRAKALSGQGPATSTAHFQRELSPAVYYRGQLLAAPADSPSILAIDSHTGQIIWKNNQAREAVHLLGVGQGNLIASGKGLWWINAETGRLAGRWPDGGSPAGYGRGVLAEGCVYWPARETIYVFDQRVLPGEQPRMAAPPIDVHVRSSTGGNLVPASSALLIAGPDRLYALHTGPRSPAPEPNVPAITFAAPPKSTQPPPVGSSSGSVVAR